MAPRGEHRGGVFPAIKSDRAVKTLEGARIAANEKCLACVDQLA
jgi:hypothetical protein